MNKLWYCLFLKAGSEFTAERGLLEQHFDIYLPKTVDTKGKKPRRVPLFPAYMFINLEMGVDDIHAVKNTKGVRNFSPSKIPVSMPADVIDYLKSQEIDGVHDLERNHYQRGDRVRIEGGPFDMYEAIIHRTEADRIWVIFDLLVNTPIEINKLNLKAVYK